MQVINSESVKNDNYIANKGTIQVGMFLIPFSVTHPRGEKNTQYVNFGRRIKNGDKTEDTVASALDGQGRFNMSNSVKAMINNPAPKNDNPQRPSVIEVLSYKETPENKVVQGEGKVRIDDLVFTFALKGKLADKPGWIGLGGTQKIDDKWSDVVEIVDRKYASELYSVVKEQADKMVVSKPTSAKKTKSW